MKKVLFLCFLLGCLAAHAQKKTIAVIGSSTAEGYGLPDINGDPYLNTTTNDADGTPVNSWVNRLRRYYDGLNLINAIDNFGIYGEDCYQGMPTGYAPRNSSRPFPDENNNVTKALSVNPDIVLVNFPSNNYDIYSVREVMRRLRTIYTTITANGHTVCYITTTQPRTEFDATGRLKLKTLRDSILLAFPGHAIDFYSGIVDSAQETSPGVPNPNYLGILLPLGQGDDVHLNEAGHAVLYNAVLARNIIPIVALPLSVGNISVKRIDAEHITVTFTVYDSNDAQQFFIQVKDKAGNQKSVQVIIPEKTTTTKTYSETIKIY